MARRRLLIPRGTCITTTRRPRTGRTRPARPAEERAHQGARVPVRFGGAYPKRSAAEYLTADVWYEFGDPNWVYSSTISTTWFESMPEYDLRRLCFPEGAKVPSVCRFWFRSPKLGNGNTLPADVELDGTWTVDDTGKTMVHAGRFSGSGKLTLFNFYRTFTQTGEWAFTGTVDQQQVGNDVFVNSTEWHSRISNTQHALIMAVRRRGGARLSAEVQFAGCADGP